MTKGTAFVLGGSGQVGRAAVRALVSDGWEVTAASRGGGRDERWPAEVRSVALDRTGEGALAAGLGDGCDVLVDIEARDWRDANRATAPLTQALDADLLDTSDLSIDAAVRRAVALVEARLKRSA